MPQPPQQVEASAGTNTVAATPGFTHLHLHTEYSLLDGGNRVDKLINRVKELGMSAVGITDHGNMFGAVAFYLNAREKGIKPILGVEAYVAAGDRKDRTYTGVSDGGYHLVLLAENLKGWQNLLYLCSEAFLTGFYFKPRIDRELLAKHGEGIIAINGHLGSEIGEHLLAFEQSGDQKHWEKAVESAKWHAQALGGSPDPTKSRFFLEMQHHISEQNSINKHMIRLSRELNLPLVCDNDSHFLRAEDHDAHDTLVCISMGKVKNDEARLKYPRELYVKSPEEMRSLFEREYADIGREACDNTMRIAERCNVELPLGASHAPMVRVRRLVVEGAPAAKGKGGKKQGEWDNLPRVDDPAFAGDLTAWYKAYCAEFEVIPFSVPDGTAEDERKSLLAGAKAECDTALHRLAEAGFMWRYGSAPTTVEADEKTARLQRELKILCDKNIAAYFLIVWDFVNWGRQKGIPAIARGSGVGTMVGFVMGLSNACPVQYGLLFERFTDPDRSEYPDIDIDLCQDGRADVINYVRDKYGHVAQIITFGTLKARAAVRDVSRVLELPLAEADMVAKKIPETLNITLDEALEAEPDLKKLYNSRDDVRRVIDTARTLEGQARHASVHAAGVIVATRPLHEIVPLYKQSGAGENEVVTQWDGPTCEKMGLLKMDFLGLRTLSIVERCKRLVREGLAERDIWEAVGRRDEYEKWQSGRVAEWQSEGKKPESSASSSSPLRHSATPPLLSSHPLDLERLQYNDQRVFELFRRADTTGVFQFESGGMRRLLVEMQPDRLEDLIAANALFRPGPMDLIPDYNRRKHGQDTVPKVHPIVDRYTAETYGVMVYQEQVMQIVHGLGGIKLRDAYSLIKNISKKKHDKIEKERPKFVDGAQKQGLSKQAAEELFELILKFAGYGFNKSHSTGYAIVAYQTAYLKTYFPNQYMAAFLTFESGAQKVSEWVPYLEDCRRTRFINGKVGVEVRPPDVNLSHADFAVVFDDGEPRDSLHGHVRFGLKGIKGVGDKAIEVIVREREGWPGSPSRVSSSSASEASTPATKPRERKPFVSLFDFCERVLSQAPTGSGGQVVNKAAIEALIRSGSMDSLHGRNSRAAMVATIEPALSAGQKLAQDKASGQSSLFGFGGGTEAAPKAEMPITLAKATPWTEAETLLAEKETIGFYVSSHPLETWGSWARVFATADTYTLKQLRQDQRAVVAGIVQSCRTLVVRTGRSAGQKMAIVTFEDLLGSFEAVMFTDQYAAFGDLLQTDAILFLLGRVDLSRGDPQLIVERAVPIEGTPLQPGSLQLKVNAVKLNGSGRTTLETVARLIAPSGTLVSPAEAAKGTADTMADRMQQSGAEALAFEPSHPFPLELVVETESQTVVLTADKSVRVTLTPPLVKELTAVLGEGTVRVVRGMAVEVTGSRGSHNARKFVKREG